MNKRLSFSILLVCFTFSIYPTKSNESRYTHKAKVSNKTVEAEEVAPKANRNTKNKKSSKIIRSWKKLINCQWDKLSQEDVWYIVVSSAATVSAILMLKHVYNITTIPSIPVRNANNNTHIPTTRSATTTNIPMNQPSATTNAKSPLVSTDQANYIRISSNCNQIREHFAGKNALRSSGVHHAIYQYLISENSPAARRVMNEWIQDRRLADYRASYGIV